MNIRKTGALEHIVNCLQFVALVFMAAAAAPLSHAQSVPAFPGAQGSGAFSIGGRGGVVMEVTNLNDTGSGSLRACVEASGPRTCVFRTGGTITLHSNLHILNPYITIAGQTAPGGGIQITNDNSSTDDLLRVGTHDVIVRYIRARNSSPYNSGSYCVLISINSESADVYNVMFDHISMAYGIWDNGGVWSTTNPAYDVTFQWSIQAEPLFTINHSVNDNISGATSAMSDRMHDIDFHHNFLTGGDHRNPIHRVLSGRIVNNLIYNAAYYDIKAGGNKDIVGNYIKAGPYTATPLHEIQTWTAVSIGTTAPPSLYIVGNAANSNAFNPNSDQWSGSLTALAPGEDDSDSVTSPISTSYRRTTPLTDVSVPITINVATDVASANGLLLPAYPNSQGNPGVGASARLGCDGSWLSNRDSADSNFVTQFINNTGHSANIVSIPASPALATGAACASTAHDGLPDQWKIAEGFNASDSTVANRVSPNGYTYLELYLNGSSVPIAAAPAPPTQLTVTSIQ